MSMYRPLWLNFTSDTEEMISEKKERLLGSSGSSKTAETELMTVTGVPQPAGQKAQLSVGHLFIHQTYNQTWPGTGPDTIPWRMNQP